MNSITKHRFTVVDHGILLPEQRIELINGEIIGIRPLNLPRANSVTKPDRFFNKPLALEAFEVLGATITPYDIFSKI